RCDAQHDIRFHQTACSLRVVMPNRTRCQPVDNPGIALARGLRGTGFENPIPDHLRDGGSGQKVCGQVDVNAHARPASFLTCFSMPAGISRLSTACTLPRVASTASSM